MMHAIANRINVELTTFITTIKYSIYDNSTNPLNELSKLSYRLNSINKILREQLCYSLLMINILYNFNNYNLIITT